MVISVVGSAVLSLGLTWLVRAYASKHIMDVPNGRSSHVRPTPRGGGVSIVCTFLIALGFAWWHGVVRDEWVLALGGGALVVSVTGFLDDHRHVPAGIRLALHFTAAALIVFLSGGLPSIDLGFGPMGVGEMGSALLAVIVLVWLLNLYNFMDGIDGIAGSQAVFVSSAGALLLFLDDQPGLAGLMMALSAASAGFLTWNWPPARIFMGDAGSGFLGLTLGGFGFIAMQSGQTPWPWLILMGVFIVDATVTLLRRAMRRMPLYQAHRSHAYQNLSRRWGSHLRVTLAAIGVNILWLAPWAFVAFVFPTMGWLAALAALSPLIVIAVWLRAGLDERPCGGGRNG